MQVRALRGSLISRCFKLCLWASIILTKLRETFRSSGIFIFFSSLKYCAVREILFFKKSFMGPAKITSPPSSPALGPKSTRYSADLMISGSCSTTSTVFPMPFKDLRISIRRRLSRAWSPMLGSSRTKRVPTREALNAAARLILWASPPLRVKVIRSRLM